MPESWSDFYRDNPCVPIDYDTLESAFDSISSGASISTFENNVRHQYRMQNSTARILLHPGPYFLRKPIVFNCIGDAEITIESISGLKDPRHALTWCQNYHAEPSIDDNSSTRRLLTGVSSSDTLDSSVETKRPSSATLRQILDVDRHLQHSLLPVVVLQMKEKKMQCRLMIEQSFTNLPSKGLIQPQWWCLNPQSKIRQSFE